MGAGWEVGALPLGWEMRPVQCRYWPLLPFALRIPGGRAQALFLLRHEVSPLLPQWRYCIRLENLDSDVVQLRERHWRIFSLSGTLETVRGRGVVGRVSIFGLMILVSGLTQQAWELKAWSPPLWLGTGSVYESTGLLRVRKLTVREASYNPFHRW